MKQAADAIFHAEMAKVYDERNRRFAPISENLHFLVRLLLSDVPDHARILCVGVGTGAEVLSLARVNATWRFVAIDPSAPMLDVCRQRLADADLVERCHLVCGYIDDIQPQQNFDAVVSALVGHFVEPSERAHFYRAMVEQLCPGGVLVNAEVSGELDNPDFAPMLAEWARMQTGARATEETLRNMTHQMKEMIHVLPPTEVERLLQEGGLKQPLRFFQSLMISGWFGRR